jgi:hypothetical protein
MNHELLLSISSLVVCVGKAIFYRRVLCSFCMDGYLKRKWLVFYLSASSANVFKMRPQLWHMCKNRVAFIKMTYQVVCDKVGIALPKSHNAILEFQTLDLSLFVSKLASWLNLCISNFIKWQLRWFKFKLLQINLYGTRGLIFILNFISWGNRIDSKASNRLTSSN